MSLRAMQRDFRAWLCNDDVAVAGYIGDDAASRLHVYQNNYRAQLIGCLEESFARTRVWIGGEAFHTAVVAHIERVSPSSWTLDAYALDFPATLAALHADDPEIAELAAIELALGEALVGPDAIALSVADVMAVDWDRAVLSFVPTLDLLPARTNAAAIWSALVAGETPPCVEFLPEPAAALLVWCHGETSRFRTIDQREWHALLLARRGMPYAGLCAALVEALGHDAGVALAGALLGRWLGDGLVGVVTQ